MNKKLLRAIFAVFLSVFMMGTSISPAVFAEGNEEPVENNEGNEDAQEKEADVRKTITEFVLGELIPDEAENTEDEALPASLPAKLEGDEEETEPTDVDVQWAEKENAFVVSLNSESSEAYVLSENAQNQLDNISVAKSEAKDEVDEESENKTEKPAEPAKDENIDEGSTQNQENKLNKEDLQPASRGQLLGDTRQTKPDTPTGLEWDNTTLCWERIDGVTYELSFEMKDDTRTYSDTIEDWHDYYFNFKYRMFVLGPSCSLTVSLYAVDGEGIESEPATTTANFYAITRELINLNADGNPIDTKLGTATVSEPTFADFDNTTHKEYVTAGESVELQASIPFGRDDIVFRGFGFDTEPTDKVASGNKVSFTLDKPINFTATFQISNEKTPVLIDFGKNHTSFADKFFEAYKDDEDLTIDANHILSLGVYSHLSRGQVLNTLFSMTRRLVDDSGMPVEGIIDNDENLIVFGKKTIDEYSDENEFLDEYKQYESETISQNSKFVALWQKPATMGEFTLTAPLCGTVVTMSEESSGQTNAPDINPTANSQLRIRQQRYSPEETIKAVYWVSMQDEKLFSGTIIGGTEYTCLFMVEPTFKYYPSYQEAPQITVNGVPVSTTGIGYIANITAEHVWNESGEVTTPPTVTSEGVETIKCKNFETCGGTKTRQIPKVTYALESSTGLIGDGSVWIKGSSGTADFEFKRSFEDEEKKQTAFDLFTSVAIDGKNVTDFTKGRGSVITKISSSYMDTLTVGDHKITAKFSDGGSVTAAFTVKENPDVKPDDKKSSSGGSSKKPTTPVDNVVTCQMAGYPSNYSWNEAAKACQPGYLDAGGNFHPYATPRSRGAIPNTGDNTNNPLYAWIFMLATALACFCGVRLLHEDWEV